MCVEITKNGASHLRAHWPYAPPRRCAKRESFGALSSDVATSIEECGTPDRKGL